MLYVVLPFLAAFPHILYQSNYWMLYPPSTIFMLLGFPLGISGVKGVSLAPELSSWRRYCCCSAVVISTIIMSGLILLRVSAPPPCKKPLSTVGFKPLACRLRPLSLLLSTPCNRWSNEMSSCTTHSVCEGAACVSHQSLHLHSGQRLHLCLHLCLQQGENYGQYHL